jgi:hypothetical protein
LIGGIIGSILCALIVIGLIVFGVLFNRRRNSKRKPNEDEKRRHSFWEEYLQSDSNSNSAVTANGDGDDDLKGQSQMSFMGVQGEAPSSPTHFYASFQVPTDEPPIIYDSAVK